MAATTRGFRPWRLQSPCVQGTAQPGGPTTSLWRDFPYEYERDRLAIDLINGSDRCVAGWTIRLRRPVDLDALAVPDEVRLARGAQDALLYA